MDKYSTPNWVMYGRTLLYTLVDKDLTLLPFCDDSKKALFSGAA